MDLRTSPVRSIGTVGATCTEVGRESAALPEGLLGVTSAVELPQGTLFVADIGRGQILRFDTAGRYLGASLRSGAGPGELSLSPSRSSATWAILHRYRGDSLVIYDTGLRRVTILDRSGRFARDFTLSGASSVSRSAYFVGASDDGDIVFAEPIVVPATAGPQTRTYVDSVVVIRVGGSGALVSRSARLATGVRVVPPVRRNADGSSVMGYDPLAATAPVRLRSVAVLGPRVSFFAERTNELHFFSSRGALDTRVLLPPMPSPTYVVGQFPSSLLTYHDANNRLWLEITRSRRDSPRLWWIFSAVGQLLGSVTTPQRQEPIHIGKEHVVLRAMDQDGVPYLRRCPLPPI
jgi:hypothetical protein